ncbi:MAG: 23S rRNA (uracil(1939)-C(5))-methyltransferase RlmD, partial [Huintestinicola sp.]
MDKRKPTGYRNSRKSDTAPKRNEPDVKEEGGNGCSIYKKCSGCQLRNMTYEEQLRFKQIKVERLMGKICRPRRIIGMDDPDHYRHKVQIAYDFIKGKAVKGIYRSATGGVLATDSCMVNHPAADKIGGEILKTALRFRISVYSSYMGTGFLRSALIRIAAGTGEIMCVITGTDHVFPSKKAFAEELIKKCPEITTLVFAVNKSGKLTTGDVKKVLYGSGHIEDIICGKRFRISPDSFAQINPRQTEVLYRTALEYADIKSGDTVIDAYCGIGTLSIMAASKAEKVYGCEINRSAVNDAIINAKLNKADNITFVCSDSGRFLEEFEEEGMKADVVILDPARAGCDSRFLSALTKLSPERIVYVSCNPETQTRDLFRLIQNGYKINKFTPVDMFPHTSHVECVCLMTKA